jgi:hypothetical protein
MEPELHLAPGIIEKMGPVEFLSLLSKRFGGRRATELIGWAILMGAAGIENGPKLRHALDQAGYSESAFYRALADWRKFAEHVEDVYKTKYSVQELIKKINLAT